MGGTLVFTGAITAFVTPAILGGSRVLVIDCDAQANLTMGLGIDLNDVQQSHSQLYLDPYCDIHNVIRDTGYFDGFKVDLAFRVGRQFEAVCRLY
jgi:cellulose biosynthesis protein BcsQ